ncbi:MAG: N-formylglutamate amidohydrolase [Deltaproteobacteria bacterium]|nr:N-formylglutamate amidohydrolase [Deltaproteobacteria bacterium]
MNAYETDAFRVLAPAGAGSGPILILCEHASARLPAPWAWPAADRWLAETHWACDLGAAPLAEAAAEALAAPAVLSRFTRLLVDANRATHSATLIRTQAEGRAIELNRHVPAAERRRRIDRYWQPYHEAVHEIATRWAAPVLLALHTFTPVLEGTRRDFDIGVLFDRDEALALGLADHLAGAGLSVRLNEPYSGKAGFIYSVNRHARQHGRRAVELEVSQDRAVDPAFRTELVARLAAWPWRALWPSSPS